MAIKEEIFILIIIGISAFVTSNKCPSPEDMPQCECSIRDYHHSLYLRCEVKRNTIQDYMKIFQKNNIADNRDIQIRFIGLDENSSIPSRVFEGYRINYLGFYGKKSGQLKNWTEEEGGPAFVGLEDTLEEIEFFDVINVPRKYDNYEQEKAPMSLGHLRKLRRVNFNGNNIDTFANGWFDKGPSSLEKLELHSCKTLYFGNRAFAGLSNLEEIVIDGNPVERVSRTIFSDPANHLKRIHLSNNKLKVLPDDMFTNMPSLTSVFLSGNPISHLPENVWRPVWSKLTHLDLSLAPLNCDDHINWMFKVRRPENMWAECAEPKEMSGVNLGEFIAKQQREY